MPSLRSETLLPLDGAVAILAADHAVLSWNHQAERLTGYTLEALRDLDFMQTFEPVDTMHQVLRRVRVGKPPVHEVLQLRTADGRHLPVRVQCAALRSRDGEEARMVLVFHEVAPLREWPLQRAGQPFLGQLAGSVSHEIRNPMNAIFLHTDIVEEEVRQPTPGDRTQVTQSLAIIKAEVTRLHALIQDYLFLARVSDLHRAPVDLRALVEELVYELQAHSSVQGLTLVLSGLDDLGKVALHESLFRRALRNILQHLMEVMPQNATLTLSGARTISHAQLHICYLGKVLSAKATEAFRVPLQTTTPEAAHLWGYMAREIMAAHGGEVAVTDEPASGMRCTITLPLGTTE